MPEGPRCRPCTAGLWTEDVRNNRRCRRLSEGGGVSLLLLLPLSMLSPQLANGSILAHWQRGFRVHRHGLIFGLRRRTGRCGFRQDSADITDRPYRRSGGCRNRRAQGPCSSARGYRRDKSKRPKPRNDIFPCGPSAGSWAYSRCILPTALPCLVGSCVGVGLGLVV